MFGKFQGKNDMRMRANIKSRYSMIVHFTLPIATEMSNWFGLRHVVDWGKGLIRHKRIGNLGSRLFISIIIVTVMWCSAYFHVTACCLFWCTQFCVQHNNDWTTRVGGWKIKKKQEIFILFYRATTSIHGCMDGGRTCVWACVLVQLCMCKHRIHMSTAILIKTYLGS